MINIKNKDVFMFYSQHAECGFGVKQELDVFRQALFVLLAVYVVRFLRSVLT